MFSDHQSSSKKKISSHINEKNYEGLRNSVSVHLSPFQFPCKLPIFICGHPNDIILLDAGFLICQKSSDFGQSNAAPGRVL